MGNDGGSIPKRRELVKEAARTPTAGEAKETLQERQEHLWNCDALTQKPLASPIVSDCLGRLYNKESVIEFLLGTGDAGPLQRAGQEDTIKGAIKTLKDVVEVKFEIEAPSAASWTPARNDGVMRTERWICPVTNKALGPGSKAVYLVPCGHAFSGVAVKEVSGEKCPQCDEPYASNDIIPILPVDDLDIARLTLRIKTLRDTQFTHSLKKAAASTKKRKKNTTNTENESPDVKEERPDGTGLDGASRTPLSRADTKAPTTATATVLGIKAAATASLTGSVLKEQEARNKRRKTDGNRNLDSLFSTKSSGPGKNTDFMSRGFAIPAHQRQ